MPVRRYGYSPGDDLEEFVAVIAHAPIVNHLRKLGAPAIHDWGFVVGDYEELVLIDPARRTLVLVAAGYD